MIGIIALLVLILISGWFWWFLAKSETPPVERGSGLSQESSTGTAVGSDENTAAELPGTWQSTEDARFIRIFSANGTVTDRYEGDDDATTSGTWNFVADPSKEQAELPAVAGMKVIKLQFPEEVMYFTIIDLTTTDLSMTYLGRGNMLAFKRI